MSARVSVIWICPVLSKSPNGCRTFSKLPTTLVRKPWDKTRLLSGSSSLGILPSNSWSSIRCVQGDSERASIAETNLTVESGDLDESTTPDNYVKELVTDSEEKTSRTISVSYGEDLLTNSNLMYVPDLISAKAKFRPLLLSEIKSFLEEIKELHLATGMRKVFPQVRTHGAWEDIEDSLERLAGALSDQEVIQIIKLVFCKEFIFPIRLLVKVMEVVEIKLQEPRTEHRNELLLCFCSSLRYVKAFCPPYLIEIIHSKFTTECEEWTVSERIDAMYGLSFLRANLPEGLVKCFYEKIEKAVSEGKLDGGMIDLLLDSMPRLKLIPSPDFQQNVAQRALEVLKANPVIREETNNRDEKTEYNYWNLLNNTIPCHALNRITLEEEDKKFINETILSCMEHDCYTDLAGLCPNYLQFGGEKHAEVVSALVPRVLKDDTIGSLRQLTSLIEMCMSSDSLTDALLDELLQKSYTFINLATPSSLVFFLYLLGKLNSCHPVMNEVCELLKDRKTSLKSNQLIALVFACSKFRPTIPLEKGFLQETLSAALTAEDLDDMKLSKLMAFADALTKLEYSDKAVGRLLIEAIFRREDELTTSRMIEAIKICFFISGRIVIDEYINKLEKRVQTSFSTMTRMEISYAMGMIDFFRKDQTMMLSKSAAFVEREKNMNSVRRTKSLWRSRAAKLVEKFKLLGQSASSNLSLSDELIFEAVNMHSAFTASEMSWILWSIAKRKYELPKTVFTVIHQICLKEIKELDMDAVSRYVFALAYFKHCLPRKMNRVANRITQLKIDGLELSSVADIAWSFSRLNCRSEKFLNWLKNSMDAEAVRKIDFCSLSNIIYTFINFNLRPAEEFLKAVEEKTLGQFKGLDFFNLNWILTLLDEFQHSVSEEWLTEAATHFESNLPGVRGQNLCRTMHRLVELGYRPSKEVLKITDAALDKETTFLLDHKTLAGYVAACGKIGHKPVGLLIKLGQVIGNKSVVLNWKTAPSMVWSLSFFEPVTADVLKVLAGRCFDDLHRMTPSNFSMLLWGLAKGNFRSKKFFAKAATIAAEKQATMHDKDLFMSFWAFARVGQPAPEFFEAVYQCLPDVIQHLNPYQLPSCAWALAKVNTYDEDVMRALDRAVSLKFNKVDTNGLAILVYSFGKQNYNPSCLDAIWKQLEASEEINSLGWVPTGHLLWGAFLLNRKPEEKVLHAIEKLITEKSPISWEGGETAFLDDSNFKPKYLVVILYYLYAQRLEDTNLASICAGRIKEKDVLESLDSQSCSLLAQCYLLSHFKDLETPLQSIPTDCKEKIMNEWKIQQSKRRHKTQSAFFQAVVSILDQLGIKHEVNVEIQNKDLNVDVLLKNQDSGSEEHLIAIAIGDKSEILKNSNEPNGWYLMRKQLLEAAGMNVIPVLDNGTDPKLQLGDQLGDRGVAWKLAFWICHPWATALLLKDHTKP